MVNEILKSILITSMCYYIFSRIANIKFSLSQNMLVGTVFVIYASAIILLGKDNIEEPYKTAVLVVLSGILLTLISRKRLETTLTIFLISYAVSYILFTYGIAISFIALDLLGVYGDNIIAFISTCILDVIVLYFLSKLKTNTNILQNRSAGGIGLIISGIVFIFYSLFREDITHKGLWLMLIGTGLTAYGLYYWWKRETVISYNSNVKDILNRRLQGTLDEKEKDIEELQMAHDYLASVVHKDHKTLDSLQRVVERIVEESEQTEIIKSASLILAEIKIYKEYLSVDLSKNTYGGKTIPMIGLQLVDAKFEILLEEAIAQNIDFDLEINGEVKGIVQIVPQLDLVNIIGDLVENSFIAIKHTEPLSTYKGILIKLGMVQGEYHLSVEDSGIPFDINTLSHLGKVQITTHADEGGQGYGYMTIFEKLMAYGASLIVTEYEPGSYEYSKCVAIRFDGKANYIVKSFRADLIRKQNLNDSLIIFNLDG